MRHPHDPSLIAGGSSGGSAAAVAAVPAGATRSGLPVGLCIDGLPGADASVLAIAEAVERAWA